jgi:hypothetical protein
MERPAMRWPLSQDYNEAIQSPAHCFTDPELRQGTAVTNRLGLPVPCSGNFADVYAVIAGRRKWAVKCFTRQIPGLQERYEQISLYLPKVKLPFMVDFTFLEQGIRVRGNWFPILKMQWVEGFTLNQFVKDHLDKPDILDKLCQIWVKLAKRLREASLAHCDLQHGNVLLVSGTAAKAGALSVKLVDYDGMCVPALTLLKSIEAGHPSYQHPQRLREGIYSLEVDRFSHLVIYTALRALTAGGQAFWDKYDNGDNLLFKQADFEAPNRSPLFAELLRLNHPDVRYLAVALIDAAQRPLEQAPLLPELVLKRPESQPPTPATPKGIATARPAETAPSPWETAPPPVRPPMQQAMTTATAAGESPITEVTAGPSVQVIAGSRTVLGQPEQSIRYSCPRCRQLLESPASLAGQKHQCPDCGQRLEIPPALPPIRAAALDKTLLAIAESQSVSQGYQPTTIETAPPQAPLAILLGPAAGLAAPVVVNQPVPGSAYCNECGKEIAGQEQRLETCAECGSVFCSLACCLKHRGKAHKGRGKRTGALIIATMFAFIILGIVALIFRGSGDKPNQGDTKKDDKPRASGGGTDKGKGGRPGGSRQSRSLQLPPLPEAKQTKVNEAIGRALQFLKGAQMMNGGWTVVPGHPVGSAALPALTLLECRVPPTDPVMQKAAAYVRSQVDQVTGTYDLATAILFLDRLGQKDEDRQRIRTMTLRLVAGQTTRGGWSYFCPRLSREQHKELEALLRELRNQVGVRVPKLPGGGVANLPAHLRKLALLRSQPDLRMVGPADDNSNTQFALLALVAARNYDVPVDRALALAVKRFRATQQADGSWGYVGNRNVSFFPTMTCAGLLGLAVGHRLVMDAQRRGEKLLELTGAAALTGDPKVKMGLELLGKHLGVSMVNKLDLYYLLCVERVGVLFHLSKIGGKEWYPWGVDVLLAAQQGNGSWQGRHNFGAPTAINTSFALLFLKRADLAKGLTRKLQLKESD